MNRRRCTAALALVLLMAASTGCQSSESSSAAPSPAGPAASGEPEAAPRTALSGELLQFRRDVERRRVQVRLTATDAGLVVEEVRLSADGFGPTADRPDAALPVGRPLDLPVQLGRVDCATEPGAVRAELSMRDAEGIRTVDLPLDDGGLVGRLHATECADEALRAQVRIELVGLGRADLEGRPALRATVRLTRISGAEPVRVTDTADNTIYRITARGPLPELGDSGAVEFDLDLLPARCDSHALGESYRTGLIGLFVATGDDEPRPVVLTPEPADRAAIESFAVDACRGTVE